LPEIKHSAALKAALFDILKNYAAAKANRRVSVRMQLEQAFIR